MKELLHDDDVREEGRAEGRAEGREEGREEGESHKMKKDLRKNDGILFLHNKRRRPLG